MLTKFRSKPLASEVLTSYIVQRNFPHWTSYFVRYKDVEDDHHGKSHFNYQVHGRNYEILRTGCYPYIKFHCSLVEPKNDLVFSNRFINILKVTNLCIPCLLYGIYAFFFISHAERVQKNGIDLFFLIPENKNARF